MALQVQIRKPRALRKGDLIRIVSPASPLLPEKIEKFTRLMEGAGYRTDLGRHVFDADAHLAGSDADRARDLQDAFDDPQVSAVMCARGGYGCARIMPLLDLDRIAASGKLFAGFSDITTLHLALNRRGLPTLHAPMPLTLTTDREPWVYESMLSALRGENPIPTGLRFRAGALNDRASAEVSLERKQDDFERKINDLESARNNPESARTHPTSARTQCAPLIKGSAPSRDQSALKLIDITPLRGGVAEGTVTGGCLILLCDSIGTPDCFECEGKIVILEDVDENPHRIDAMLTHLLLSNTIQKAAGIVIGEMTRTDERRDEGIGGKPWREIVRDRLGGLGVPTIVGYPFGHCKNMLSLPLGIRAKLDADAGTLTYTESLCA